MERTTPSEIDGSHAAAVLDLAETLFCYGQFRRVLSLLDLADWMSDGRADEGTLRIRALCRVGRVEDARELCRRGRAQIDDALRAELFPGAGEAEAGAARSRGPE